MEEKDDGESFARCLSSLWSETNSSQCVMRHRILMCCHSWSHQVCLQLFAQPSRDLLRVSSRKTCAVLYLRRMWHRVRYAAVLYFRRMWHRCISLSLQLHIVFGVCRRLCVTMYLASPLNLLGGVSDYEQFLFNVWQVSGDAFVFIMDSWCLHV